MKARYKYWITTVLCTESENAVLQTWGNDGWELVSVIGHQALDNPNEFSKKTFYFKKQV